jgi:chemotaxis protein MotB
VSGPARRTLRRGDRRAEDAPAHDRWLLSYADFVTLLLAVFLALFAYSRMQKQGIHAMSSGIRSGFEELGMASKTPQTSSEADGEPAKTAEAVKHLPFDTAELKSQLEGVLGDGIGKHEIVVQQTSEGLIISLRDFGFFNSGEAELLPGAAAQLRGTAQVLMQHKLELRVEGHSDDQPIHTDLFQSNWELSTARAMSVLRVLIDDAGFPPEKISVAGYGPYRPVADDATAEGRRMNRRVDLVIIEPKHKVAEPDQKAEIAKP